MTPHSRPRRDSAAPVLLVAFFAASLTMVVAVVVLLNGNGDWADVVAIGLLAALAAIVLALIRRELAEDDPAGEDAESE